MTGPGISYVNGAAEFTVAKAKDAPTIQSNFYIFGGSVSVIMKAAKGKGVVSSIVLESDDLDEVDWYDMPAYPSGPVRWCLLCFYPPTRPQQTAFVSHLSTFPLAMTDNVHIGNSSATTTHKCKQIVSQNPVNHSPRTKAHSIHSRFWQVQRHCWTYAPIQRHYSARHMA